MNLSKLRIGDLVYCDDKDGWKPKGLVIALNSSYLAKGCIEILERRDGSVILSKKYIVKVIPREQLTFPGKNFHTFWWRLL
jgi:hypothetical protein